ncbi:hypothetical protein, partial [Streptomyces sp. NPDC055006]
MRALRVKRLFAVTATGVLMAGGAAIGTAGTASANTGSNHYNSGYSNCYNRGWGWSWDNCRYNGHHRYGGYNRGYFYNDYGRG